MEFWFTTLLRQNHRERADNRPACFFLGAFFDRKAYLGVQSVSTDFASLEGS